VVARAPDAPAPVGAPHHQTAACAPTALGDGELVRGFQARALAESGVAVVYAGIQVHAVGRGVAGSCNHYGSGESAHGR